MNLKGHLSTGIITSEILLFPFIKLKYINLYLNTEWIKKIDIFLGISNVHSILFGSLIFILGTIFPDLDQLIKNHFDHYTKHHRQITHSLLLIVILIGTILYFYIFKNMMVLNWILLFFLGVLFHCIIDIFFGKGGIPLFLYTNQWKQKYRISVPLFANNGIMSNLIISLAYILSCYLLVFNYKNFTVDIFLIGYIFLLSYIKNTFITTKILLICIFITGLVFKGIL